MVNRNRVKELSLFPPKCIANSIDRNAIEPRMFDWPFCTEIIAFLEILLENWFFGKMIIYLKF